METNQKNMVTIIVPIFNNEGTIEACVNSIRKQTYANIEIILVDDGATDNTGIICDKLSKADERIRVIHQKNKGLPGARNAGMKIATAEYVCFVDGDDEISEYYVEKLVQVKNESNADLVVCGIAFYENNRTWYLGKDNKEIVLDELLYEEWLEMFKDFQMIPAWNKLFSKKIIEENGLQWMEGIPCGEDGIFVFDYLRYCKKISFVRECLYNYYIFRTNSSKRFWPLYGQITMFELKSRLLEEHCANDKSCLEKYQARKALHNIHDRIIYLVKKSREDLSEGKQCFDYYWRYVEPFANKEEYFDEKDWEWLNNNRKSIVTANVKGLFKGVRKSHAKSFSKRLKNKVRNYCREKNKN